MFRRVPIRAFVFSASVASLGCVGCASTRPVTWDEIDAASAQGARGPTSTTVASMTPRARPALSHDEGHGEEQPAAGVLIDSALQEFTSHRAQARRQPKTSPVWGEAWERVLRRVEAACQQPPRASDLGAFVRARATLEVELTQDRMRGLLLPDGLERRVTTVLVAVDEGVGELRAANVPGTMAPSPRLEPGELVLHAPLAPMVVSSPFGLRGDPFTGARRFHAGVDLDAPQGSNVYASAGGLVVYAGTQGGYGKQIVIDHGDGVRTHYSHLQEILVSPGETVDEESPIALVGSTGRSTGPHLHFAVTNEDGDFLDPTALLDVPWSSIAQQVKVGPAKNRRTFAIKKTGEDSVEISSLK